jgi:hypothetical protein
MFSGYGKPDGVLDMILKKEYEASSHRTREGLKTHREYKLLSQEQRPACLLQQHHGPPLIPARICSGGVCEGHEDNERGAGVHPSSTQAELQSLKQAF